MILSNMLVVLFPERRKVLWGGGGGIVDRRALSSVTYGFKVWDPGPILSLFTSHSPREWAVTSGNYSSNAHFPASSCLPPPPGVDTFDICTH